MACNENVIKNMANEITRNCQGYFVNVDPEFVTYLIDLLLLNPKYRKLFAKTINRNSLAYFVNECVTLITRAGTDLDTLKTQFIMYKNYNNLKVFLEKHHSYISKCVRPLLNEIVSFEPDVNKEDDFMKLYRKMSIYMILATGLGNLEYITNIKEGLAALQSVFNLEDLQAFVALNRVEKLEEVERLTAIVSGVRLFNKMSNKGGESIQDLTSLLYDAGKSCTGMLSKTLIKVMKRINTLTTAIYEAIVIQEETGNVVIDYSKNPGVCIEAYKEIFDRLCYYRQYEAIIRKLLADVQDMTKKGTDYLDKSRDIYDELCNITKYKDAVPVHTVFPQFIQLWEVWSAMQDVMYLITTVTRLMGVLTGILDHIKINFKVDTNDVGQYSNTDKPTTSERISLATLCNYVSPTGSGDSDAKPEDAFDNICCEFMGFCALCLNTGALIPGNLRLGVIKVKGLFYSFCSVKMAVRFSKEPERYINEVLHFARNNPHFINLLNITKRVYDVKDVDELVVRRLPKTKTFDTEVQTEPHPHDKIIVKNYSSNLWEHKRNACQWANIVTRQTHSTQTVYTHNRSEVQCQTTQLRDKCFQTNKDSCTMTPKLNTYLWGLRGQRGDGQHSVDLTLPQSPKRQEVQTEPITVCRWPCIGKTEGGSSESDIMSFESHEDFYRMDF